MPASLDRALFDHDDAPAPDVFLIAHDDYHARYVGRTADGQQFLITTPFTSAVTSGASAEFVARYLFDGEGDLMDAQIVALGPRPEDSALPGNPPDFTEQSDALAALLAQLGPVTFDDITIAPFSIVAHGHVFGMVLNGPDADDPDEEWYWNVTVEPGDYMAFYAPWDSGEYDT
jgi:hypothetical protein